MEAAAQQPHLQYVDHAEVQHHLFHQNSMKLQHETTT
jgi:hypothetical protein